VSIDFISLIIIGSIVDDVRTRIINLKGDIYIPELAI
jgi:hypothetical protein